MFGRDAPKILNDAAYQGFRGSIVVVDAIIPVNDTHLILKFNYENEGERRSDKLMFKMGRMQPEIDIPDDLKQELEGL